ncbi:hypothetical protein EXIGLDRAFT_91390 [Exidia glandulosa HHB12029]|uniref:Uncharacterized protein n=1 Tax=Exidia glandulosa HHB12029 TaxID=1314781 RepID=A0A165HB69_EXIGL|nr:hypothetical protein EXIGLDRAFT_91390 [Exidia glandulosa HHB12029]
MHVDQFTLRAHWYQREHACVAVRISMSTGMPAAYLLSLLRHGSSQSGAVIFASKLVKNETARDAIKVYCGQYPPHTPRIRHRLYRCSPPPLDLHMDNISDLLMDNSNSSTIDESLWDEQQQGAGALDPLAELLSLLDDPLGSQDGLTLSMSEEGAVDISSLDDDKDFSSLLALLNTPSLGPSEYSDTEHGPSTPPTHTIAPRDAVIVAPPTPPAYQSGLCVAVKDVTSRTAPKPAPNPQPAASQLALPSQPYRVGVASSSTPAHSAPTAVHPAAHVAQMDPRLVAQMQQVRAIQLAQAQAQQQANLRMQMQMQMYQFAYLQQRHYYAQQQQQQQQGPGPIRSAASNSPTRAAPYTVPPSRRSKAAAAAPPQPSPSPVASTSAVPSQPGRVGMQQELTLPADDLLVMGWTART